MTAKELKEVLASDPFDNTEKLFGCENANTLDELSNRIEDVIDRALTIIENKKRTMNELKFNSAICTSREQSERLLALGLKKETADMSIITNAVDYDGVKYSLTPYNETNHSKIFGVIPAWSLHRLIEMMPTLITSIDYSLILGINATCVYYVDDEYAKTFKAIESNLYDCVVKCIEWLIKEGYFNKDYLEEKK